MGLKDFAAKHQFDAKLGDYSITGDQLRKGLRFWPLAGAVAEFEHGANVGSRVTLTRVALVGIFALGLKKDRNKVYVAIELRDGQQVLVEAKAKEEKQARVFANKITKAGEYFASA